MSEQPRPCVTLIVPIRNEEASIGDCLDALVNQSFRDLEILVIDGMSNDRTVAIVEEFMAKDARIRLVVNEKRLTQIALNVGLAQARGTFLVRVDGHSLAAPDYVERIVDHLKSEEFAGVGGTKLAVGGESVMSQVIASALSSRFGVGGSIYHYAQETAWVDHIPFGAYRVDLLRRLGGWDESLLANEDFELDYRIRRSGGRLLLDPKIRVYWKTSQTLRDLSRQYQRYGRGKAAVARIHPDSLKLRHMFPAAVFLTILGSVITVVILEKPWPLLFNLPYGAFLVAALGDRALRKSAGRSPWMVPAVLVTMEMSWAWGFLRDITKKSASGTTPDTYTWRNLSQEIVP
jgi:succinoglycan biosynthesis protein ExoA